MVKKLRPLREKQGEACFAPTRNTVPHAFLEQQKNTV